MSSARVLLAAWCIVNAAVATAAESPVVTPAVDETGVEFFERRIRPILVQHCYACHGRGRSKGGLSLDSREAMLAGGESGTVVVLGKPDESLLIEAVQYGSDLKMPPSGKLTDDEIAALEQWLAGGAPWPEQAAAGTSMRSGGEITDADRQFWSFQPIRDPAPPPVRDAAWPCNSIDAFVLARLESEGLQPVGEADRATLIRRATFDLTGLPPAADEVDAFLADTRPDAYERLVDRLLASPRYGERWARHWLDVARYGEDQAHTFQARLYPSGYRYRDWVVDAFNRDLPFDRFVVEQIAGDLVNDAGSSDRLARLPALGFFALGPVYYADNACAGKAKFDEYDDRVDTLARGFLGLTVACARCHDHKFDPITMRDYYALAGVIASSDYYEAPLAPAEVVARYDEAQAKIKEAEDQLKQARQQETYKLGESFAPRTADYLLAVWRFDNRRKSQPDTKLADVAGQNGLEPAVVERWQQRLSSADQQPAFLAPWRETLAGQVAVRDLSGDTTAEYAAAETAAAVEASVMATFDQRRSVDEQHAARLAALKEGEPRPEKPALDKAAAEILKFVIDDRNAPLALPQNLADKLLADDLRKRLADKQSEIDEQKKAAGERYPIAHSIKEGKPANVQIHLRGSPTELGDEAPRGFLAVLSPADAKPFEQGSGRLELARAIADRHNPLTARVFVNRIWQQHFGRGIVGTASNFGLLGERPTHPELLDYLASRFIASGWSIKSLHREIMLSATYRLASTWQAAQNERDPDNRLYWRMNRRRLDVEAWRDALLFACDNLEATIGGPSQKLDDANNRRRTLYAAVSRHQLNPMLRLFDFPDPNLTSERRVITTVPMQQLFVLNSDFMVRQAKALAAQLAQTPDENARIELAYRRVFGRPPHDRERQFVLDFLAASAANGDQFKLSAWEQLTQALLASNEFVFVD